jgi:predicted ATP-dependent protease
MLRSGVQRDVLKLYRMYLREIRKREPGERDKLLQFVRDRFKEGKNIPRFMLLI